MRVSQNLVQYGELSHGVIDPKLTEHPKFCIPKESPIVYQDLDSVMFVPPPQTDKSTVLVAPPIGKKKYTCIKLNETSF